MPTTRTLHRPRLTSDTAPARYLPTRHAQGNTCGYDPTHAPNDGGVFGPYLDAMFSVIAHELTEWTTDPDGYQWFKTSNGKDNGMENADLWCVPR